MSRDPAARIDDAIDRGLANGLASLHGFDRLVFLISEAEVLCDKDGIDAFIEAYGESGIAELAHAYSAIGAGDIANALRRLADALPGSAESILGAANRMICDRHGYSYDDIVRAVVAATAGDAELR